MTVSSVWCLRSQGALSLAAWVSMDQLMVREQLGNAAWGSRWRACQIWALLHSEASVGDQQGWAIAW